MDNEVDSGCGRVWSIAMPEHHQFTLYLKIEGKLNINLDLHAIWASRHLLVSH